MMISLGILSMCWWRKNIIIMLMSLEMILISLYFTLTSSLTSISLSSLLLMLVMMVSGSSLGLTLLVSMSNSHNSTNSSFINMMTFVKNYVTLLILIAIQLSPNNINFYNNYTISFYN